jgi:two-component system alkaline phosphatase synthesis response regulator PhoP
MTSERKRVFIVDDEASISEVVGVYLEGEGIQVEAFGTVAAALDAIGQRPPDMVILDVGLPDGSGLDILRRTSAAGRAIPTIMLTARSDETDRIVGLELGADDYVTKPFSPRELTARVRALFRRLEDRTPVQERTAKRTSVGELVIDHEFHEVRVGNRPVNLTATEFRILALLAENPGGVFTRSHLLDRLNDGGEIFERTLDRHINNLRKKVEEDPTKPEYVITVYGVGYKMRSIDR